MNEETITVYHRDIQEIIVDVMSAWEKEMELQTNISGAVQENNLARLVKTFAEYLKSYVCLIVFKQQTIMEAGEEESVNLKNAVLQIIKQKRKWGESFRTSVLGELERFICPPQEAYRLITVEGVLEACVVVEFKHSSLENEMLITRFENAVRLILMQRPTRGYLDNAPLLKRLAKGERIENERITSFFREKGFDSLQFFQVYCLVNRNQTESNLAEVFQRITQCGALVIIWERKTNQYLIFFSGDECEKRVFRQRLESEIRHRNMKCGVSWPGADIGELPKHIQYAILAAEYGENAKNAFYRYEDAVLPYLAKTLRISGFPYELPCVKCLKEYDDKKDTEYMVTLRTYLSCNQNLSKASQKLYIQKSTLNYRLDKISEIMHLDVKDVAVRMLLELALFLEETEPKTIDR